MPSARVLIFSSDKRRRFTSGLAVLFFSAFSRSISLAFKSLSLFASNASATPLRIFCLSWYDRVCNFLASVLAATAFCLVSSHSEEESFAWNI